ncbi:hypothetical protein R1flu_018327 [Riccia fluitans]|uniref:Uncharacterized protein n=1 Tax=Riccia fluitans TaxID=41844 RepID=A0ABD1ZIZ1_9MARC
MGLGGYLAAKSDADQYWSERKREEKEIQSSRNFVRFGLQPEEYWPVVNALKKRPQAWIDFMMRFELGLEKPDPGWALQSALTIAGAYIVGGIIPLFPYVIIPHAVEALKISVGVTLVALIIFGFVKGMFTGTKPLASALQTAVIGATASAVAFGIARAINS